MEFGLSEDQRLFQDTLRRFLAENASLERLRSIVADGTPRDATLWRGLSELGLPGLVIEERHGGVGLRLLDAALVAEALGHHVVPAPYVGTAVMVPLALRLAGGAAQQDRWLPKLASGECVAGIALSEVIGSRENARVESRSGRLSGKALFVLDFDADLYVVADRERRLHLVEADARGLTRRRLVTVDKTRPIGELVFEDVAAEPLDEGDARETTGRVIDAGRVMLAADTLGAAQYMLDRAVEYALQREQFGRVIGSFQAVKHMCAEMAAHLEPCRAMVWYAGHALDELPDEAPLTACHTKAHVAEVGRFVAKTATEVHGGMGFTDLLGLHYWFKRIGFDRQLLGGPEQVREEAARLQRLA